MIITITMNPSLDLNYITETFSSGKPLSNLLVEKVSTLAEQVVY